MIQRLIKNEFQVTLDDHVSDRWQVEIPAIHCFVNEHQDRLDRLSYTESYSRPDSRMQPALVAYPYQEEIE